MGARVALRSAQYGCEVIAIARDRERTRRRLEAAADEVDARAALAQVTIADEHAAASGAEVVYEAIPERLAEKQNLFAELESIVDARVPIVSGTSTFFPEQLASSMQFPARVFVAHFVHPVTMVPLAEIVAPADADAQALAVFERWIETIALEALRLPAPLPGFIINRLQFALLREALHIVERGGATAEQVDRIMRLGLAPRWTATGPIASVALGGPATFADVARSVVPTLDAREEIPFLAERRAELAEPDPEARTRAAAARKKAYAFARSLDRE
jgi:3-hydroxybutyryl-CoA dehydrogenase